MSRPDEPKVDGGLQAIAYWLDYLFERDHLVHATQQIIVPHHNIHGGNYWSMGTRLPALNGSVSYLLYSVGTAISLKNFHFFHGINSSGVARICLYQDPTVVAPGTLLVNPPWMNHKQGSIGTPSSVECYIKPNISDLGTLRTALDVGGTGVGGSSTSGHDRRNDEIIFDNDKYWLVVVDTDDAQIVNYEASGYEK